MALGGASAALGLLLLAGSINNPSLDPLVAARDVAAAVAAVALGVAAPLIHGRLKGN